MPLGRAGTMAATAATVERANRRASAIGMSSRDSATGMDVLSASAPNLVETFSRDMILDSAHIEKLGADYTFAPKNMTLTTEKLWFSEGSEALNQESDTVADYILLHEIDHIRHSTHVQDHLTNTEAGSSAANSRLGAALTRASSASAGALNSLTRGTSFGSKSQVISKHNTMDILTVADGLCCGRTYTVRLQSLEECEKWIAQITKEANRRRVEVTNLTTLQSLQRKARHIYGSFWCQLFVAIIILANFIMNAIQAEYEPQSLRDKSKASAMYEAVDIILVIFFCCELAFNMFGHWFWDFFTDGWSVFDLIVVTVSVISLVLENIPGVSILRVLRAFRILRLIKRFESLRQIMNAIIKSIIPVLNAILIGMMVLFIYTIIGVYLFAERSEEKFGRFGRAMYTLFELVAFTIWPLDVPAFNTDNPSKELLMDADVVIFVVTFMAIVGWTLLQVVVAVLLDNFMGATAEDKANRAKHERMAMKKVGGALDPLLLKLSATVDTEKELGASIHTVWKVVDLEGEGRVSFMGLREGLLKLNLTPRVRLTEDDFTALTENQSLCDMSGMLTADAFRIVVHRQLAVFVQRHLSDAFALCNPTSEGGAILQGLRHVLMVQSASPEAEGVEEPGKGSASPLALNRQLSRQKGSVRDLKRLVAVEEGLGQMRQELADLRRSQEEGFERMRDDILAALQGVGGGDGGGGGGRVAVPRTVNAAEDALRGPSMLRPSGSVRSVNSRASSQGNGDVPGQNGERERPSRVPAGRDEAPVVFSDLVLDRRGDRLQRGEVFGDGSEPSPGRGGTSGGFGVTV